MNNNTFLKKGIDIRHIRKKFKKIAVGDTNSLTVQVTKKEVTIASNVNKKIVQNNTILIDPAIKQAYLIYSVLSYDLNKLRQRKNNLGVILRKLVFLIMKMINKKK